MNVVEVCRNQNHFFVFFLLTFHFQEFSHQPMLILKSDFFKVFFVLVEPESNQGAWGAQCIDAPSQAEVDEVFKGMDDNNDAKICCDEFMPFAFSILQIKDRASNSTRYKIHIFLCFYKVLYF